MIKIHNNHSKLETMNFPDGESFVKFNYDGKPLTIVWQYENDSEIMTLGQIYSILQNHDLSLVPKIKLYIPYFPHARQDRHTTNDQPFSLYVMLQILKSFVVHTSIYVLDIHSDEIYQHVDSRDNVGLIQSIVSSEFAHHLSDIKIDAILCPDNGAKRRAREWAKVLKTPIVYCSKNRDPETGKLSLPTIDDGSLNVLAKSSRLLMVDDIGTGFGTHIMIGEMVKKLNPAVKLDLWVSHSSFTRGAALVLSVFDTVFTTNSLISGYSARTNNCNKIITFDCLSVLPNDPKN